MKDINFINPIPPKKQEEVIYWLNISIISSGILIAILICFSAYHTYHLILLKQKKQALYKTNAQLQTTKEKRSQLEKTQNSLQEKIKKIELFNISPKLSEQLLQELSKLIPSDIALLSYKQINESLELEGLAFHTTSILNFLQDLKKSPYFEHMLIGSMQQETKNAHGNSLVRFSLKSKLKHQN